LLIYHPDRKITPGVMGQLIVRVRSKQSVWYFVVGSTSPDCAQAVKGRGVHSLKCFVSWVQTGVRQVGFYLYDVYKSERKVVVVRKEKITGTSGQGVI
jgi:hypothetical protein